VGTDSASRIPGKKTPDRYCSGFWGLVLKGGGGIQNQGKEIE